jgi:hypothetical protein
MGVNSRCGKGRLLIRNLLCYLIIACLPMSLLGADTGAALVDVRGSVWLNGSSLPRSGVVFPGDWLQTQEKAGANLHAAGTNVVVLAETLVQFQPSLLAVEYGGVTVVTSTGMTVQACEVRVTPTVQGWTEFQVANADGKVHVNAQKGDVIVSDSEGKTTVSQGQQTTRECSSGKKLGKRGGYVPPGGQGGILSSRLAIYTGIGVVGGVTTWVLLQGDEPLSPWVP